VGCACGCVGCARRGVPPAWSCYGEGSHIAHAPETPTATEAAGSTRSNTYTDTHFPHKSSIASDSESLACPCKGLNPPPVLSLSLR
jgi:hypothetical protein